MLYLHVALIQCDTTVDSFSRNDGETSIKVLLGQKGAFELEKANLMFR